MQIKFFVCCICGSPGGKVGPKEDLNVVNGTMEPLFKFAQGSVLIV
jgi:hypothetical protein